MSDNSAERIAGDLTVAILGRIDITDANDAIREASRVYRTLLRRIKRVHEEEEPLDSVLEEPAEPPHSV